MVRRTSALAKTMSPDDDAFVWEPLYALADQVYALEPWDYHPETDIFGVQNPQTGEVSYICVMGGMGTHSALSFYRGTDGLNGLLKMHTVTDPEEYSPTEVLSWQDCLMLSFEDRNEVSEKQRARIKALKKSYRGSGAWPHFQDFTPGYLPWEPDESGLGWFKTLLGQALDVLRRTRDDFLLIPAAEPLGPHLVRVQGEDGAWEDMILPVAPRTSLGLAPAMLDTKQIAELKTKQRVRQHLELGSVPYPEPTQEHLGDRPYFVHMLLVVEPDSTAVFGQALSRFTELPTESVQVLAQVFREQEILPSKVCVSDLRVARLVKPFLDALEIPLETPNELPGFEKVVGSLMGFGLLGG